MLFQKTVLKKYLATLPQEQTQEAWSRYSQYFLNASIQQNILQSKEEQFQEGFLRELFVKVLGYTLNPSPDFNLITEQKNHGLLFFLQFQMPLLNYFCIFVVKLQYNVRRIS